jgi:hypothetical protein
MVEADITSIQPLRVFRPTDQALPGPELLLIREQGEQHWEAVVRRGASKREKMFDWQVQVLTTKIFTPIILGLRD